MNAHRVVLGALLCAAAACNGDEATPLVSPVTMVPPGTVQVLIQQDRQAQGSDAVFIVQIVPNGVPVAAYQGEITFEPGALSVKAVQLPEAKEGEFRVVNSEEFAKGRIKFAVFGAEALASTVAFRITATLNGDLTEAKLLGALTVVGEASGRSVAEGQVRQSIGVYDSQSNALLTR